MKKQIFIKYLDLIVELFGIDKSEIFINTKRREVTEARQLLYYLCYVRPMRINEIQKYMAELGYDPKHPPIVNGIKTATLKIESDKDYQDMVRRIQNSVFI
jgi:chromosomal replication initiation ATPase DnaA